MKKEAYEVEYYEPKSVLAMQADRREEKHRRKQKKGIRGRTYPAWGRHPAVLGDKCTSGVDR